MDGAIARGIRDPLHLAASSAVRSGNGATLRRRRQPRWWRRSAEAADPAEAAQYPSRRWQNCRMPSATFTSPRPSRQTVWRQIRALRSRPPGRAGKGEQRRRVFGSALEQAEQLLTAAEAAGYASRPILLFYGLSQAGRAIAASTAADNNSYQLSGHGIKAHNLGHRTPLAKVTVKDDGRGSFTQLAHLLGSISLREGTPLGQLWATIPDLRATPLGPATAQYLPVLQLQREDAGDRPGIAEWIVGLSERPGGYSPKNISEEDLLAVLGGYPTLAGSLPFGEEIWIKPLAGHESMCTIRCWPYAFPGRRDQPYRDDYDRWVFPPLDDRGKPLHPLLAWWALLFALSMLARYEPASWISHLDVDASPNAVPLEAALDQALHTCPELVLHAIRAVAG